MGAPRGRAGRGRGRPGPKVSGTASGNISQGSRLTIRIDAVESGGWQGLHQVAAVLLIDGRPTETLSYDVENQRLAVGDQEVFAGTGGTIAGSYLRVSGAQVVVTTGGANLSITVSAVALRAIPDGSRFRLQATDDAGLTSSVTQAVTSGASGGGVSWSTVLATVAVALFAGAFIGNLFASRRRPPPRLSLYSSIQRRIDDERRAGTRAT